MSLKTLSQWNNHSYCDKYNVDQTTLL